MSIAIYHGPIPHCPSGQCSPGDWQIAVQLLATMPMWRLTPDVVTVNSGLEEKKNVWGRQPKMVDEDGF